MDTVVERSAVTMAVDALVRDKTAVPDIDSVELYEWALQGTLFPSDFSQTLGTLRARWAKANPASPAVVDCLKACVVAWDLVNAQQVCLCFGCCIFVIASLTAADRRNTGQGTAGQA